MAGNNKAKNRRRTLGHPERNCTPIEGVFHKDEWKSNRASQLAGAVRCLYCKTNPPSAAGSTYRFGCAIGRIPSLSWTDRPYQPVSRSRFTVKFLVIVAALPPPCTF